LARVVPASESCHSLDLPQPRPENGGQVVLLEPAQTHLIEGHRSRSVLHPSDPDLEVHEPVLPETVRQRHVGRIPPRAISTRPQRVSLLRGSKTHHRPPKQTSIHAAKSICGKGGGCPTSLAWSMRRRAGVLRQARSRQTCGKGQEKMERTSGRFCRRNSAERFDHCRHLADHQRAKFRTEDCSAGYCGREGEDMCGFVCLWRVGDEALAGRMIRQIAHRGPDAVAIARLPDAPVVMAHCRLSIIGTEDGAQPIHQTDDLLVVNGEIYNHEDLRAILGESAFETASDSETILHLFRSGASRWISKLDGMFAFVLATRDRVIAARDPLGIKPLYLARIGDGYAFASELKAFDGVQVDSVEHVPPGGLYDSRDGWRQWYRTPHGAAEAEPGLDLDHTARELRLVLEEAVAKWMVADVEVGSFLSGGLDSSIIAAIAQKVRQETGRSPLRTFSVGLEGAPDLAAARAVADHIGSIHREMVFTPEDVAENLAHVIYHLESADVDLVRSAIPTLFAARLAREDVKAVLTGEGADELFAGYAYHHDYVDDPRALADELTRSLGTMHNINLQRVDRVTMAESLEARTPFLDRELIDFAQSVPAELKLRRTDPQALESTGETTEKWILRKACADLLPADLVWRKKAQFDEGSGTVDALQAALQRMLGVNHAVSRAQEAALYERILREQYADPDRILQNAGTWTDARVAV
jgi:asparagine synthase (glutamine-hydrolysing)